MKTLLVALSLLASIPAWAAESHAGKVIRASAREERAISEGYDIYLSAVSHQVIARNRICFPMSLVKESSDYFIVERGYYISPRELRGFGLAIPKSLAKNEHGELKATDDLVMESQERRQGLHTVVLSKRKVEQDGPANRSRPVGSETKRMSAAAGSGG